MSTDAISLGSIYNREKSTGNIVGHQWQVLIYRRDGKPTPKARRTRLQPSIPMGFRSMI
jgi:hypothetical protein